MGKQIATREYVAIACNDRFVIMAAAMRRTLMELLCSCDPTLARSGDYSHASFQGLQAQLNALRAGYWDHLPRKMKDRFEEIDDGGRPDQGKLHNFMIKVIKGGLDHVGSARAGVSLASFMVEQCLWVLVERQIVDEGDDEPIDAARFSEALGELAQLIPVCQSILDAAVRRYLADVESDLAGRGVEVICHDLSAPVLMIAPSERVPLIGRQEICRQMPAASVEVARTHFPHLMDEIAIEFSTQGSDDRAD